MTELDPQAAAWLQAARAANAEIAKLTEVRDRAVEHVKTALGNSEQGAADGKPVVTWAWSKPATFIDKKALEADLPDIAAKYTKTKTAARPFKILDI